MRSPTAALGKNSVLVCREMSTDGRRLVGDEQIVVDGRNGVHPTIEGPKFYKRGEWYYILAPAGGVKPGWQLAARAKSPLGPYEAKRVMEQGTTHINGPHQGGLVELENGENWFVHFQDHGAYGRRDASQPGALGRRLAADGPRPRWQRRRRTGNYPRESRPSVAASRPDPSRRPTRSMARLGCSGNGRAIRGPNGCRSPHRPGWLRLYAAPAPPGDLTMVPNQLLQKFAVARVHRDHAAAIRTGRQGRQGRPRCHGPDVRWPRRAPQGRCPAARTDQNTVLGPGGEDQVHASIANVDGPLWLRVTVADGAKCRVQLQPRR